MKQICLYYLESLDPHKKSEGLWDLGRSVQRGEYGTSSHNSPHPYHFLSHVEPSM
jgi:hypothetical protein